MDLILKYQQLKARIESIPADNDLMRELENYELLLVKYQTITEGRCQKYKMLFDNAADSILIHKEDTGKILFANATACNIYQYTLDELTNLSLWDIDTLEQVDYVKEKIHLFKDSDNVIFETRHKRKDGSAINVGVHSSRISWYGEEAVLSISRDVTEQKNIEKALSEEEIRFSEIIRQTNDGIIVFDDQKKIVVWNKGAEKIFGVNADEIINQNIVDVQYRFSPAHLKDRNKIDRIITSIIRFEDPLIFNTLIDDELKVNDSETNKYIESLIFPIKLSDTWSFGIVMRDISEKKNYEKKILQINTSKDRFLQILAHDLRNPFNALMGYSDLLLSNLYQYDLQKIEHQLNIQKKIIQRTYGLLEDLLFWSKSQLGMLILYPEEIVLEDFCLDIMNRLRGSAKAKNISIKFFESEPATVSADKNMLNIVIRNLLNNAIKFTYKGGIINVFTWTKNNFVEITVSDNGIGMSEETIKQLWDLGNPVTTKGTDNEDGTGLGLIICRDLIEKHGGKIWVKSEPGKGSDFTFSLPSKSPA